MGRRFVNFLGNEFTRTRCNAAKKLTMFPLQYMISQTEFTRRMESAIGLALACDSRLRKKDLVYSPY